jgi:hypothetical protein
MTASTVRYCTDHASVGRSDVRFWSVRQARSAPKELIGSLYLPQTLLISVPYDSATTSLTNS